MELLESIEICKIEADNLGVEFVGILSYSEDEIEWIFLEDGQECETLIYL